MKGIFWNSRGLRDLAKFRYLAELSRERKLDFIALSETGKKDFAQNTLAHICGGQNFFWHWSEPRGRSGGILLGMNLDVFDIGGIDEGEFHVKSLLRNKEDGFKWAIIAVYGAAQDGLKEAFLAEFA
jgi:hypothetical protein